MLRRAEQQNSGLKSMHELDLEEIKREIVEGRSLTIKTNNLVNALSADLKSLSRRLQVAERRNLVHSVTTYLVAVGLILGLSKLALDAQVETVQVEKLSQSQELEALQQEFQRVSEREEKRITASRTAAKYYQLIVANKSRELLKAMPELNKLALSKTERAVFDRATATAQRDLSFRSYESGVEHLRAARFHEASLHLKQSLELEPDSPHAPSASLELARAYRALDQQKLAIIELSKLTEASTNVDVLDEATFLMAECETDIELYNDAKATIRRFLRRFPDSSLRARARKLLSELNLYH